MGRFNYVEWDEEAAKTCQDFKTVYEALDVMLSQLLTKSRESSLAITKIEESFMWVGKAIRNDQILRQTPEAKRK